MTNPGNNSLDTALDAVLDESGRRYYLDAMGIQCWQLLEPENAALQIPAAIEKEVVEQDVVEQNVVRDVDKSVQYEVLSRGNESADMMFVLLSPGFNDKTSGELCSGEEGALLTKMLAAIKVSIADVYITSLLKSNSSVADTISSNEMEQCKTQLKQQIQKVKPKVLIALGEASAQILLKQKMPLDRLREQVNTNGNKSEAHFESVSLFVSYSPAELLQKAENKRKAWLDLQQLQKRLQG
jgi:DNA polymerase